jgi:hypothetical protein
MMFLIGGVPDAYWDSVTALARGELQGHFFTGKPLRRSPSGYVVTESHCEALGDAICGFLRGRPDCLADGLGIVMVLRPWESDRFREAFFPFGLYCAVRSADRPVTTGSEGRRMANAQARDIITTAKALIRPAAAVQREVTVRLKRTPLLLPFRHFGEPELARMINDIAREAVLTDHPDAYIRQRCSEFEYQFPFQKSSRAGGRFLNSQNVTFATPGRALHGSSPVEKTEQHNNRCILNAHLRGGGPIMSGFHFDCSRGRGNYSGDFADCHGSVRAYVGKPHLNVHPNDFIRG